MNLDETLKRYTKEKIIEKYIKSKLEAQEEKKEMEKTISKLKEKNKLLERDIKNIKANVIEKTTKAEVIQDILKLKAKGKGISRIYEILNENRGLSVHLKDIKSVYNNIDELSEELKEFYNKQTKLYFDNLSFSKDNIIMGDVQTINLMIETSKSTLEGMAGNYEDEDFDFESHRKLQEHISRLIKDKNSLIRNLIKKEEDDDADSGYDIQYENDKAEELNLSEAVEDDG